jgi:hypothetical protein
LRKYVITFRDEKQKALFVRKYRPLEIVRRHDPLTFFGKKRSKKGDFRSPNHSVPYSVYQAQNLKNQYRIHLAENTELDDADYNSCDEIRTPRKLWAPLNVQQLTTTTNYSTYETIDLTDFNFVSLTATTNANNSVVGPWYVSSSYVNLTKAWDASLGEGMIVSAQEKFDYTNVNYNLTPTGIMGSGWITGGYHGIYPYITGGTHPSFKAYSDSGGTVTSISGMLPPCYWYSGGEFSHPVTGEGCIHAFNAGDSTLVPITSGAFGSPRTCYLSNFHTTTGNCTNGQYRTDWIGPVTPDAFTPYGHGDPVTGIFGSRISPTPTITSFVNAVGNVGVVPSSLILVGGNEDDYDTRESDLGLDVRIGAFDGQWSQTDSTIARSLGTILVRGPGTNHNINTTEKLGYLPPYDSAQIATASLHMILHR